MEGGKTSGKLPQEIVERCIYFTQDWELAVALFGAHACETKIKIPTNSVWQHSCTPLDWAILSGDLPALKAALAKGCKRFTHWGARVMLRFGYVDILAYLYTYNADQVLAVCGTLLPTIASAWGRVAILEWARSVGWDWRATVTADAMDEASRHGQVSALDWWLQSSKASPDVIPLLYSEHALASATVKEQIPVLDWWKQSGLPLKTGFILDFATMSRPSKSTRSLDWWAHQSGYANLEQTYTKAALYHSSTSGSVLRLQWWRDSRFPLVYDKDVLIGATKNGHVAVLQWWAEQVDVPPSLQLEYRFFDIEEALEDAVSSKIDNERTLKWWHDVQGYEADVSSIDQWMLVRKLKSARKPQNVQSTQDLRR